MMNPAHPPEPTRRTWIAVIGALMGAFMAVLDVHITNSSLKNIQGSLGASLDEGSWISTGYLISEIVVIPLTGFLSSVFSLRRYLAVNAALFIFFSVLCGLATSLGEMVIFRILQGAAGGVLIPLGFTIVMTRLPLHRRPLGAALISLTATFAPAMGPTLGGWLTDLYGWPFIFFVNVVPGLILVWSVWTGLDSEPLALGRLKETDVPGIVTMAIGLGSLTYVLEEGQRKDWFGDGTIRRLFWIGAISLLVFIWIELRRRQPLINLRLLARRSFGAACAVNMLSGLGLYGTVFILPLYLAQIQGYNSMQIGEVVMWVGLPQLAIIPFVPRIMRYVDTRVMIAFGMLLFGISCFMNSFLNADTAIDQLKWAQLVRALGQPFILAPLSSLALVDVEPSQAGSGSALFNIMRNLGGSIGIAGLSTLLARRETYHFSMIGDAVTRNDPGVVEWLADAARHFAMQGAGPIEQQMKALGQLAGLVRREAFIMAYGDCFFVIGVGLVLSLPAVLLLKRPPIAQGLPSGDAH
jgi:DHA2 family multidrug resistance protein